MFSSFFLLFEYNMVHIIGREEVKGIRIIKVNESEQSKVNKLLPVEWGFFPEALRTYAPTGDIWLQRWQDAYMLDTHLSDVEYVVSITGNKSEPIKIKKVLAISKDAYLVEAAPSDSRYLEVKLPRATTVKPHPERTKRIKIKPVIKPAGALVRIHELAPTLTLDVNSGLVKIFNASSSGALSMYLSTLRDPHRDILAAMTPRRFIDISQLAIRSTKDIPSGREDLVKSLQLAGISPSNFDSLKIQASMALEPRTRELYSLWGLASESQSIESAIESKLSTIQAENVLKERYDIERFNLQKLELDRARIIHICKTMYPNFWNPSSEEYKFKLDKDFDIKKLPPAVEKTIMTTFESRDVDCEHTIHLKRWWRLGSREELDALLAMSSPSSSSMYSCKVCSRPTICPHEVEYEQTPDNKKYLIKNKYCKADKLVSASSKSWNCYICGQELWAAHYGEEGLSATDSSYRKKEADELSDLLYRLARDRVSISKSSKITTGDIYAILNATVRQNADISSSSSIIIYAYATIVAVCEASNGELSVKSPTSVVGRDLKTLFINAYAAIVRYNGSDVSTLSSTEVKEMLIRAYGKVKKFTENSYSDTLANSIDDYSDKKIVTLNEPSWPPAAYLFGIHLIDNNYPSESVNLWKTSVEVGTISQFSRQSSEAWNRYFEKSIQLLAKQAVAQNKIRWRNMPPISRTKLSSERYWKQDTSRNLNKHICSSDGRAHKWAYFRVNNEDIAIKDVSPTDSPRLIGSSRVCSKCEKTHDELQTSKLDLEVVRNKWREYNDLATFYRVYETRCPVDGFHEFRLIDGEHACEKCKMLWKWWRRSESNDWYKNKAHLLTKWREDVMSDRSAHLQSNKSFPVKYNRFKVEVDLSEDTLLQFLAAFRSIDITKSQIFNLGSSEGADDKDVKSTILPSHQVATARLSTYAKDAKRLMSMFINKKTEDVSWNAPLWKGTLDTWTSEIAMQLNNSTIMQQLDRVKSLGELLEAMISMHKIHPAIAEAIVSKFIFMDSMVTKYDFKEITKKHVEKINAFAEEENEDEDEMWYDMDMSSNNLDDDDIE